MSAPTYTPALPDVVPVVVRGGVATLRPLQSGEHAALDAVFDALSPASRYDRYLTDVPRLTPRMRAALTAVDGHAHTAWLAEVGGHPAGIGRLVRVAPGTAEIALEVTDRHQGRGLGTALLDTLLTVASATGIHRLQATVVPTNHRSLHLLSALSMTFRSGGGVLEGTAPVKLLDTPVIDRQAVARLALAARDTSGRLSGPA